MTVPPKRPRDQRPIPNEERILHAFEQQVRNLLALDRHVGLVLDAIENRQPALTTDLRQRMSLCDHAVGLRDQAQGAAPGVDVVTEWELSRGERLIVATAGLDWARGLIRWTREHLRRSDCQRAAPIAESSASSTSA